MSFLKFNRLRKSVKNSIASISIVIILLPSFLFLAIPKKAEAQWPVFDVPQEVNSFLYNTKEFILDGLAYYLAKMVLQQMTRQTVKWINSGFKGNPGFVTNPDQFFLDIADRQASRFITQNESLNKLCQPFNIKVRLALVKNYINEDQDNYSCTIDSIVGNFDNFTKDFTQGGWDGWFVMTQTENGNPIGAYVKAQNNLSLQIGNKTYQANNDLLQGKGFLSYKTCPEGKKVTAIDYAGNGKGMKVTYSDGVTISQQWDSSLNVGDCGVDEETTTPGATIAAQLDKSLGSSWEGLVQADEINEILGALFNQLISRVVGGIGNGLRGLSQKQPGENSSFVNQLEQGSPESNTDFQNIKNNIDQNGAAVLANPPGTPSGSGATSNPLDPEITLIGENPMNLAVGEAFVDPGVTVTDPTDGDISSQVLVIGADSVDTSKPGTYTITYTINNSLGLSQTKTRTVNVQQAWNGLGNPGTTSGGTNGNPVDPTGVVVPGGNKAKQ